MKRTPPLRLRDDPRAPSFVRRDLACAADRPATPFDAVRGLAALEAAIGQAGPAAPPPPPPPPTGPAAAVGATPKLAGAVVKGVLCGVLAVGAAGLSRWGETPRTPRSGLASVLRDRRDASTVVTSAAPPVPPTAIRPAELGSAPEPRFEDGGSAPAPSATTRQAARLPVAPAPVASASELQLEMDLLGRLRALEPGDPQQALALAEEGRRRFSPGFFGQERETLAISALAKLGRRDEARARARAFLAAYPRSHFVERVRELARVNGE